MTINLGDPMGVEGWRRSWSPGPTWWWRISARASSIGVDASFEEDEGDQAGPDLISVGVAGRTGPLSSFRGYGNSAAALSGQSRRGRMARRRRTWRPFAYGDVVAPDVRHGRDARPPWNTAACTGEDQRMDISQAEPLMHALSDAFAEHECRRGCAAWAIAQPCLLAAWRSSPAPGQGPVVRHRRSGVGRRMAALAEMVGGPALVG